jgi:carboxypeptidase Q
VKVPHWVRGEEQAELTDYPARPDGVTQRLRLTTLGGSSATARAGLERRVIVVHDFNELRARVQEVLGNVIADWPGAESADQFVVVSGHLDSWDLGTGATDDGVGVAAAAGVIQVLHDLNLRARRTVRFIGWANEENGTRDGEAYFNSVSGKIDAQCAAIESDSWGGHVLGLSAAVTKESLIRLKPVIDALAPLGATALDPRQGQVGTDIGPLQTAGVPGLAPLVDTRHYFDYHHTAADTLDKVDPGNLRDQVATLAVLAYYLADTPACLPRVPKPDRR